MEGGGQSGLDTFSPFYYLRFIGRVILTIEKLKKYSVHFLLFLGFIPRPPSGEQKQHVVKDLSKEWAGGHINFCLWIVRKRYLV